MDKFRSLLTYFQFSFRISKGCQRFWWIRCWILTGPCLRSQNSAKYALRLESKNVEFRYYSNRLRDLRRQPSVKQILEIQNNNYNFCTDPILKTLLGPCANLTKNLTWTWTNLHFCRLWQKCHPSTLFEIFIFCPKIQLWFPDNIVDFLHFLSEKLAKMLWFWTF